jgi:hypothetical protein
MRRLILFSFTVLVTAIASYHLFSQSSSAFSDGLPPGEFWRLPWAAGAILHKVMCMVLTSRVEPLLSRAVAMVRLSSRRQMR